LIVNRCFYQDTRGRGAFLSLKPEG
jgi:hypothetical protein